MEILIEQHLKPGAAVVLAEPRHWPGIAKARGKLVRKGSVHDQVPAGAVGTLAVVDGMWVIRFKKYPADPEWPCLIGFYPAKLPPWIIPASERISYAPDRTVVRRLLPQP